MNRWVTAAVGAVMVVAAWGVALVTPSDDDVVGPFSVQLALGEHAAGRNLGVTLEHVRRAASVSTDTWSAEGNWVVVDLSAEAIVDEFGASLRLATLTVGDTTYQASERPASFFEQSLAVGIPRSGSLAFELPEKLPAGHAVLTLALNTDTRLDSAFTYDFDLAAVAVEPEAQLLETGWGAP